MTKEEKEIIKKLNYIYNTAQKYKLEEKVYTEMIKRSCSCLVVPPNKLFYIK